MSRLEWHGTNEFRRNTKTSGRESVARETKEILKDCHGNRCFGNRVLKAYRESALQRRDERGEGVDREGWKRGGRSNSGEAEDGPKETTLTFGCHIRPRDSNRSHGSNFLGWTWELDGKRQLRPFPPTTLSRILQISSRDITSVILPADWHLKNSVKRSNWIFIALREIRASFFYLYYIICE